MIERPSADDIDVPGLLLTFELGVLLFVEGVGSILAFALGTYIGRSFGGGLAGGILLLVCYGVGKTWLNVRLLNREFRGEIDHRFINPLPPLPLERPVLKSVIWGGSEPPRGSNSPSRRADPRLLIAVGLSLPLLVLGGLLLSGNPYLVFLIPVVAVLSYYAVGRLGAAPIRPRPYHVGLALTLTHSLLPFAIAFLVVLYGPIPSALPDVFPYSVEYHWGYSPLHRILLPLTMVPVVYVSNYCLLLAYDSYRRDSSFCPNCGVDVAVIGNLCPSCEVDRTEPTGESRSDTAEIEGSSGGGRTTEPSQTDEYTPWSQRDSAAEMEVPLSKRPETVIEDVTYIIVITVVGGSFFIFVEGFELWHMGLIGVALIAVRIAYWRRSPKIGSGATEPMTDATCREGGQSRLLWAFTSLVPVNAALIVWASGFRPIGAVGAVGVPLVILGVVSMIDGVEIRFREPSTLVAGTVGGLVGCAVAYAVPFVLAPAGPYRYVVWLPVAALVGYVTAVLLYEARESGDRATRRSG